MERIAIIGCGISGMTLAKRLSEAGITAEIFEKESKPGGIARGFKSEGWKDSVEFFYHHWFQKDDDLLGLIDELGLKDRVKFRTPKTVMFHKGKFYRFDTIPAALVYPGLGYGIHKIRFGLAGVFLRLTKNWQELEKFIILVIDIAGFQPSAVVISVVLNDLMHSLVDEAMNVIVVRCFLIHRKMVNIVRGL